MRLSSKLITSKCLTEWKPSGDVNLVDMGNDFYLIRFSNVSDCNIVLHGQPWFVEARFCAFKFEKKKFDPVKEKIQFIPLWIRILPLEMWNELILRHILSPIGNLLRIDHKPEKVSKGLIARVCVEFDIIKPVKKRLKYFRCCL